MFAELELVKQKFEEILSDSDDESIGKKPKNSISRDV